MSPASCGQALWESHMGEVKNCLTFKWDPNTSLLDCEFGLDYLKGGKGMFLGQGI